MRFQKRAYRSGFLNLFPSLLLAVFADGKRDVACIQLIVENSVGTKLTKPRRTAVLALLALAGCASTGNSNSSRGRLLLVPPLTSAGSADTDAPLSKWQSIGHFSSLIDCNNWMTREQFAARAHFGPITPITNAHDYYESEAVKILNAQCVSPVDPKLKGY
jgi:hypothetical protein